MRSIVAGLLATVCIATAHAECTVADVTAKLTRARWVDGCTRSPCPALNGAAVVTHQCRVPIGVQLRLVGYDRDGTPVAVTENWPWSVDSRPAGVHPISIDHWLKFDPDIERFGLSVVGISQ